MATLLAHVKVKPGLEDHWESIARDVWQATHDNEPGCLRYEYWRGSDPRTYYVLLSFESFEAFMEHQIADYHHDAGFGDCFEEFTLEWVDPVDGASDLPPSQTSGTPDPGRSERWNTYVTNHSEPVPGWWPQRRP